MYEVDERSTAMFMEWFRSFEASFRVSGLLIVSNRDGDPFLAMGVVVGGLKEFQERAYTEWAKYTLSLRYYLVRDVVEEAGLSIMVAGKDREEACTGFAEFKEVFKAYVRSMSTVHRAHIECKLVNGVATVTGEIQVDPFDKDGRRVEVKTELEKCDAVKWTPSFDD